MLHHCIIKIYSTRLKFLHFPNNHTQFDPHARDEMMDYSFQFD